MSMYVTDAGSKCLVKNENLDAAYGGLEEHGEYAYAIDAVKGCTVLSADGNDEFFCGSVSCHIDSMILEFLEKFCEPGSYVCQRNDDYFCYDLYWKDDEGIYAKSREFENPFEGIIGEIERKFQ